MVLGLWWSPRMRQRRNGKGELGCRAMKPPPCTISELARLIAEALDWD
jgi:hypothetical protein